MKDLTMRQAIARVKQLANGKYHSVQLQHTNYGVSKTINAHLGYAKECRVYISGMDGFVAPTFREAIDKLEAALKGD